MDGFYPHFTVRTLFSFLLLILLHMSTEVQTLCTPPRGVKFPENEVGVVTTIPVDPNVTLTFTPPVNPDNPFALNGANLEAERMLDFENKTFHLVKITCTAEATGQTVDISVAVDVINLNDNPPVFPKNPYNVNFSELSPVGTPLGTFAATDKDDQQLKYKLTPASGAFKLSSPTSPVISVATSLDYDKVKHVQLILTAEDTLLIPDRTGPPFTATTTINVNIVDVDNRPPWFQPCTQYDYPGGLVCQSSGYTGKVNLNEQATGVLPLKPGPLYAIDGDFGINQEILYSFLTGSDLFTINENSGNITMVKPADVLGPISLTVLATQRDNKLFATTAVTISVQVKSLHPPKFQKRQYKGTISAVGKMAMDANNKDQPLIILATDDDYAATEGRNPDITYSVKDSSDFSIIDGYLFMIKDLPEGSLSLTVVATDTKNDESDTAPISLEVTSGLNTTTVSMSTAATTTGESTTDSMTTEDIMSTTNPSTAASTTSEPGTASTASTPHINTVPSGSFGSTDMAILGATLGVFLFICLVVIGVLACQVRRGKADWQKIYETSMFRSSLGQGSGGQKEGIQYTNDAFQNDEDGSSTGSIGPEAGSLTAGREPWKAAGNSKVQEANLKYSVPLHALLPDNTSQTGSDKDGSEKGVKPILTRERRIDEGYKSVWFKEDIVPNAKEEVVIIPDSRESDSDEEDDEQPSSSKEEDREDSLKIKTQKVGFNEIDLDSGLGVKMEDPADDSEDDEVLNKDL